VGAVSTAASDLLLSIGVSLAPCPPRLDFIIDLIEDFIGFGISELSAKNDP
jgi:hypothetical protein